MRVKVLGFFLISAWIMACLKQGGTVLLSRQLLMIESTLGEMVSSTSLYNLVGIASG